MKVSSLYYFSAVIVANRSESSSRCFKTAVRWASDRESFSRMRIRRAAIRVPMLATTGREESIWPTLACSCGPDQVAKQCQVLLPQHEDVQPAEQGVELIGGELAFLVEFGLQVPQAEVDALDPRPQLLDIDLGMLVGRGGRELVLGRCRIRIERFSFHAVFCRLLRPRRGNLRQLAGRRERRSWAMRGLSAASRRFGGGSADDGPATGPPTSRAADRLSARGIRRLRGPIACGFASIAPALATASTGRSGARTALPRDHYDQG